jgi:hypothetical protein
MKNIYTTFMSIVLLLLLTSSPLLANSMDGLAQALAIIAVIALVVLITPIITAIIAVIKNNQKLKVFSKMGAFAAILFVCVSAISEGFKPWAVYAIGLGIAVLPLIILAVAKERN